MRSLHVSLIAVALLVGSAIAAAGQSDEGCVDEGCVVAEFSGRLAFGMCGEVESPGVVCDQPAVLVAFSDPRLAGEVAITGRSQTIEAPWVSWRPGS